MCSHLDILNFSASDLGMLVVAVGMATVGDTVAVPAVWMDT